MTMTVEATRIDELISDDDVLYHKHEITDRFGEEFWEEVVARAMSTTTFTRHQFEVMLDDIIAYFLARVKMRDIDEALVANLLPDQAQHVFLLYTREARLFFQALVRTRPLHWRLADWLMRKPAFLDHDPASESALVNFPQATAKTVGLFRKHGIRYHKRLWEDHIAFPRGAAVLKTGLLSF